MEENNFYRLKSPYSARAEGHVSRVNAFLLFAIAFTAVFIGILIYTIVSHTNFDLEAYLVVVMFVIGCSVFLGFGIKEQIAYNKLNAAERKLLKNCLCTDGIIIKCNSKEYEVRHGTHHGGGTYRHKVTILYSFCDDKNQLKRRTFVGDYDYNPEFYVGQWLMIAFNETDSTILGKFSFVKEDQERFLKNEAERSADDFDDLDGKPLEVDPTKKIQSAELEYVWFWAAFGLFIFLAGYTIPISIFATPALVMGKIIPDIFIYFILYLLPVILTVIIICFLVQYVKKRYTFKKILNNQPNFVWGKMFASEKTYRSYVVKKVYYCYIDKDGNRFTKTFSGPAVRAAIQGYDVDVAVMYDKDGNSIPLYNYKFTDEE